VTADRAARTRSAGTPSAKAARAACQTAARRRPPKEIPGGFWCAFEDPSGNLTYILDQSTAEAAAG
jgi:hypothetical protein